MWKLEEKKPHNFVDLSRVCWISVEQRTMETARSVHDIDWLLILCLRLLPYMHKQKFYPQASVGDAKELLWKLINTVPVGQVEWMRRLSINFKVQKCRKRWELRMKTGSRVISIRITEFGCKFQKISLIREFCTLNWLDFVHFEHFMWVWMESLQNQGVS